MHHQFTPKEIHRFWSKVDMSGGPNSCWEWQGSRDADGYGRFTSNRSKRLGFGPKSWVASRAAWLIHTGHLPGDLLVCHHCDNPPCVNPAHLFLGTNNDNMRDMNRKGRHPRKAAWNPSGETNPRAKMTDEQVIEARRRVAE